MLKASWKYHWLVFKNPAGTSRGVLSYKDSWFLFVSNSDRPDLVGIGECGIIPGLSPDPALHFVNELDTLCHSISDHKTWVEKNGSRFPSIKFGLETAICDLENGANRCFYQNDFVAGKMGIPINGLIWMGNREEMKRQVIDKIANGFGCLKVKIGALDFDQEIDLLKFIRKEYKEEELELRLDANGAFYSENALKKLKILSEFEIHSIEQPIKAGQAEQMAKICQQSPIKIALDEELIGIYGLEEKIKLLETIKPTYIILKPSLIGGFKEADEWINITKKLGIGWWATSALESNVGLNAIAQWVSNKTNEGRQGLGTGQLYLNNFISPLEVKGELLFHCPDKPWDLNFLNV